MTSEGNGIFMLHIGIPKKKKTGTLWKPEILLIVLKAIQGLLNTQFIFYYTKLTKHCWKIYDQPYPFFKRLLLFKNRL